MGSSAQNSSGVHWCRLRVSQRGSGEGSGEGSRRLWCRRRVRFNKVPEKGWEALVQSQVRFNSLGESGAARSSSTAFRREGSGAETVPEKVPEKVWETLVQSHVKFNRVPEKVPEKVVEKVGEGWRRFRTSSWCRARSGSTALRRRFRLGAARFNEASSRFRCDSGSVSAQLFFRSFQQISDKKCENNLLLLLGIPPKLNFCFFNGKANKKAKNKPKKHSKKQKKTNLTWVCFFLVCFFVFFWLVSSQMMHFAS